MGKGIIVEHNGQVYKQLIIFIRNIWPFGQGDYGFQCPHCGHDQTHWVVPCKVYPCNLCRRQTAVNAGTFFLSRKPSNAHITGHVFQTHFYWTRLLLDTRREAI